MFTRIALAAVTLGVLAACQPRQPEVVTQPVVAAPIPGEVVYSGKYGN